MTKTTVHAKRVVQGDLILEQKWGRIEVKFVPWEKPWGVTVDIPVGSFPNLRDGDTLTMSGLRMELTLSAA